MESEVPTSAKDYRAMNRKVLHLRSGAKFLIRKTPPEAVIGFLGLGPLPKDINPNEPSPEMQKKMVPFFSVIFPACCLTPKVVERATSEDEIEVSDIHFTDAMELFTGILEFSHLTKEAVEARSSFRSE